MGTDRRKTGLDESQIGARQIRGGQCEKFQMGSLLGPDFFESKSLMDLTRSGTERIMTTDFYETD
jgi:hypothetical protein